MKKSIDLNCDLIRDLNRWFKSRWFKSANPDLFIYLFIFF